MFSLKNCSHLDKKVNKVCESLLPEFYRLDAILNQKFKFFKLQLFYKKKIYSMDVIFLDNNQNPKAFFFTVKIQLYI